MNLKSLAKDTAIYGLSSIVGRFLNYLLVPLYTYKIAAESGNYGIVTNLYAYTALLFALLTFGMETTLFRFSNKDGENPDSVYGTSLKMIGILGLAFIAIVLGFLKPIAGAMGYDAHPEYVGCMAVIVAMDAFQAIMFSKLRLEHRPFKFMALKFAFIIPNILLNLYIFFLMPHQGLYERFDGGVGLIFFSNLICTSLVFLGFIPELRGLKFSFDGKLAKRMLKYAWPLLLLSLVGVFNQVADKIIYPWVMPGKEGMVQLGIYGSCVKIAMIMSLLTQAFRYAYEPIVFSGSKDKNNPKTLADGMKYFIIFTMLAFLAVVIYMPVIKHIIAPGYWEGLAVVPVVMLAEIFMGIYFNLSFWYKLTDQAWWGAVMSTVGALVMVGVNVLLIPKIGYWACAWGGFAGYGTAMLMSWAIERKKFPIPYDGKSIFGFCILAAGIFVLHSYVFKAFPIWLQIALGTMLMLVYMFLVWKNFKTNKK